MEEFPLVTIIISGAVSIVLFGLCLYKTWDGLCTRIVPYVSPPPLPSMEMTEEKRKERLEYILRSIGQKEILIPSSGASVTTATESSNSTSSLTRHHQQQQHKRRHSSLRKKSLHILVPDHEEHYLEEVDLELGLPTFANRIESDMSQASSSSSASYSEPSSNFKNDDSKQSHQHDDCTDVYSTISNDGSLKCCPICMEEFKDKDNIAWSYNEECPHIYHVDCIVQWLMTDRCVDGGDECPMCRSAYLTDDPAHNSCLVGPTSASGRNI